MHFKVVGFNSLADVLKRLDFRSAVHDIRRFQYVAAIIRHLVVPDRFYQLSGASQIFIFRSVSGASRPICSCYLFIYLESCQLDFSQHFGILTNLVSSNPLQRRRVTLWLHSFWSPI